MGTNSLGKNITQLRLFFRWCKVVSNRQLMLVRTKKSVQKEGYPPFPEKLSTLGPAFPLGLSERMERGHHLRPLLHLFYL